MARILVVEDEAAVRDSLRRMLEREGHDVEEAEAVAPALALLAGGGIDALLTDIRLPDGSGLELIAEARGRSRSLRILAVTAFGSVDVAVDAMRRGADDFLEKPFRAEALRARLERALEPLRLAGEVSRLRRENEVLREALEQPAAEEPLVGASAAMTRLRELVDRVAASGASILVRGETGTGKELVARRIHRQSPRAERPFVTLNCGAVPEGLIESELFGHERGAFTGADRRRIGRFELAEGGTLFLDEIGELAPALQVKLLRALQERRFERVGGNATVTVDVRIVAATHRDLEQALREGRFREDLYYRLNVVRVDVPPLRERPEDVPALVELFLERYGRRADGSRLGITPEATAALQAHSWPGNVRQLENAVHRATVLCAADAITVDDVLPIDGGGASPGGAGAADLRSTLNRVERELIERALREHGGNLTAAGRALGVERNLLRYKLRKHGLRS